MEEEEIVLAVGKVFGKGKLQIPIEIRGILDLNDGDRIYFKQTLEGKIVLSKAPQTRRGKYAIKK